MDEPQSPVFPHRLYSAFEPPARSVDKVTVCVRRAEDMHGFIIIDGDRQQPKCVIQEGRLFDCAFRCCRRPLTLDDRLSRDLWEAAVATH